MVSDLRARVLGCLLGGAVGDALGAPVEFMRLADIRARHGPDGITGYSEVPGRKGAITDDTQMTLFTAEGLIRGLNRFAGKGISDLTTVVWHAYLRWLDTQARTAPHPFGEVFPDGWLVRVDALRSRRAPGETCLHALASGRMGTFEEPINDSKGCGGIMRVAPVGLARVNDPFHVGAELAAITHGHPTGYLAAGFLAHLVRALAAGVPLPEGVEASLAELRRWNEHEETEAAVMAALKLAADGRPSAEALEALGRGWVAEEALAIALAAALAARDFADGLRLAANHSGDSDSTASIAGQLLGAAGGVDAIPAPLLDDLELREEITTVAEDVYRAFHVPAALDGAGFYQVARYPGW